MPHSTTRPQTAPPCESRQYLENWVQRHRDTKHRRRARYETADRTARYLKVSGMQTTIGTETTSTVINSNHGSQRARYSTAFDDTAETETDNLGVTGMVEDTAAARNRRVVGHQTPERNKNRTARRAISQTQVWFTGADTGSTRGKCGLSVAVPSQFVSTLTILRACRESSTQLTRPTNS